MSIEELFGRLPVGYGQLAFFPPKLRNMIIEAGSNLNLLDVNYDGFTRVVEPYSLVYKTRKDGRAQEYFYAYDRTGGRSGPGIKAFVHDKVRSMTMRTEQFTPRFPVEVSKAGEFGDKTYFSSPFRGRGSLSLTRPRNRTNKTGVTYIIECHYCGKEFRRSRYDTTLREHKDKYGNLCYGRVGYLVDQIFG